MNTQGPFVKIRFTGPAGATAGIILPYAKVSHATISELSRHFPMSEANKMRRLDISPQYALWDDAFTHQFEDK